MAAANKPRLILDTNIIISGVLFKDDALRTVLSRAFDDYEVVFSYPTWDDLCEVMQREQCEPNLALALGVRLRVIAEVARRATLIDVKSVVTDCRDSKGNKFLPLALDGEVKLVVTGDADLLALNPWRGVRILRAREFLGEARAP